MPRSASGNLLSNGRVRARGPVTKTVDVDDGTYHVQGLPSGNYELEYVPHESGPGPEPSGQITVSGTEERVLDLRP